MPTTNKTPLISSTARSLSVLVPALNEESNLAPTIKRLIRALNITIEDYEIVVIDDGSTDDTGVIADRLAAENPNIRVIHNKQPTGLGHAYVQGIDAATKNYFIYIPGDNTWPYRSFLELFGNLGKADIVTSYSTNPGVRPLGRRAVSRTYTIILNLLFGHHLHYFNGLTIYPLAFLQTKPVTTYGFGFQAEVLIKALRHGLSYIEVALPIDERTAGSSKAVTVRNIVSVAVTVLRLFSTLQIAPRLSHTVSNTGAHNRKGASSAADFRLGNLIASSDTDSNASGSLNIVVTGASSGIGAELTKSLAQDGHRLFVCARREEMLRQVTDGGRLASFAVCDVTDESHIKNFMARVSATMSCVDVLINCAGSFGAIGQIEQTDSKEWLDTITINLFGPYLMTKHALPLLLKSSQSRVINFSGGGAFSPFPNYSAYACSKAALVRLTECLAAELAPLGIAVNAIAPGIVATSAHEATLRAGEQRAGTLYYRRTLSMLEEGGAPMNNVIDCVRELLSPALYTLTGKTISANFDPWRTEAFKAHVFDITRSDLYAMRRINIVNLPDGLMRTNLSESWASFGTDR